MPILMHIKMTKSPSKLPLTKLWVNQNLKEHQMKMFGVVNGIQDFKRLKRNETLIAVSFLFLF